MQYISDVLYDKSQLDIWAIYLDIYIYAVHIYVTKKFFQSQGRLNFTGMKIFSFYLTWKVYVLT